MRGAGSVQAFGAGPCIRRDDVSSCRPYRSPLSRCVLRCGSQKSSAVRTQCRRAGLVVRSVSDCADAQPSPIESRLSAIARSLSAFYRFTRPHTVAGTVIAILSVSILALRGVETTAGAWTSLGQALLAAVLMNISIVGLNQVCDVEIDKINKPELPLASGEWRVGQGMVVVVLTGLASLLVASASSIPLFATCAASLVLGVLYSVDLPFLRWKQHPVLAAGCILAVRALFVQLGFFLHMRQGLGLPLLPLGVPVVFTMVYMVFMSVVIAICKDLPDSKGDSMAGISTLTVRIGRVNVFRLALGLLSMALLGAILFSAISQSLMWMWSVAGHLAMLGWLWLGVVPAVDLANHASIVDFYMSVWKLFYAEYLLIPLFA